MPDTPSSLTDYLIFALLAGCSIGVLVWRLRRLSRPATLPRRAWSAIIVVLLAGIYLVEESGKHPQQRAVTLLEGIAPTYADELTRMGHADLKPETAEEDPKYLAMIEAERRWVKLNPLVSDIYTFRRRADGVVYLMVDAETDYNHSGAIEPGREERTRPGEVYPDTPEELRRAFAGERNYTAQPTTDRWGTWVSVFVPMYDRDGHVEAVLGVDYDAELWFREITVRRRAALAVLAGILVILGTSGAGLAINRAQLQARMEAEENMHAADARLRAMLDHLPFALWLMGPGGDCVAHNPRATEIRGVRFGITFFEMRFTAAERKTLVGDVARARSGEVISRDITRDINGENRHYVQLLAPVPEMSGGIGLVVVELDATDRVEAERRRNQSERRLALHVEQTPLAYIEWDENLRILRWNPAAEQLFGYAGEEALGRSFEAMIVPETARTELRKVCRLLLTQKGGQRHSMENATKDGRIIVCEWHNTPLIDENGRVIAIASHAQNVTERLELEARLRQTQKLESMGQLAGGVAHEFNNLLTPMLVQIGLIGSIYSGDERLQGMLKPVEEAIMQAAQLNQRILAVGRRSSEVVIPTKLNPLVENALDLLRQTFDRRIELRLELARNLPSVLVTKESIMQVVMNLALNARDTLLDKLAVNSKAGWSPRFTIGTALLETVPITAPEPLRTAGHCVVLSFRDNGAGMGENVRRRVYEPFFTTKAPGKGTGLGLAVVWNVIDGLGGSIELESIEGEGTLFRVYLPISTTDRIPALLPSSVDAWAAATRKGPSLRIAWVEDNQLVRETFAEVLTRAGHSVDTAANGQFGLEMLLAAKDRPYDVLLLDLNMPVLSGREVLAQIKGHGLARHVIVVSGLAESGENSDLSLLGADLVLRKPLGIQELLRSVGDIARKIAS
jgi:two-component system, cell cycle sensor histidine kinase and response regulator CckA